MLSRATGDSDSGRLRHSARLDDGREVEIRDLGPAQRHGTVGGRISRARDQAPYAAVAIALRVRTAIFIANGAGQVTNSQDYPSIEELVRQVLAYAANSQVDLITAGQRLCDLGIDSISGAGVVVVLEAETGVAVSAEELAELFAKKSVGDLVDRIARAL